MMTLEPEDLPVLYAPFYSTVDGGCFKMHAAMYGLHIDRHDIRIKNAKKPLNDSS
ncbi:hypothetical protein JCM11672_00030 [Alkaliphilus crotonatoxidans]